MKKVFAALALVVVVLAVVLYALVANLDTLVKDQIESIGSEKLGTAVRVENINLQLMEGLGEIQGFSIANPQGFENKPALSFETVRLNIDTESLANMPIVIEEVLLDSVSALYEMNAQGKGNLNVLADQARKNTPASADKPAQEESAADGGQTDIRLKIQSLTVKDTQLALDFAALGDKAYSETLPSFTLTNIGGSQGLPPAELGSAIADQLLDKILGEAKKKQTEKLKNKAKEKAMEKIGEKLDGTAGEAVKGFLDKL